MLEISRVVIKKNLKYLLVKRSAKSSTYPNLWEFPGGKNNKNESTLDSVIRETKEETNLDIYPGEEIKKVSYYDKEKKIKHVFYIPKIVFGEIKLSNEHSEYKWVAREEFNKYQLHPFVELFFK